MIVIPTPFVRTLKGRTPVVVLVDMKEMVESALVNILPFTVHRYGVQV